MKRVYVVQGRNDLDLSSAKIHGELVYLTPQAFQVYTSASMPIQEMYANLRDFNDDDSLLLIGDPVLIGLASMIACEMNSGVVNMLKWDRKMPSVNAGGAPGGYKKIKLDISSIYASEDERSAIEGYENAGNH